MPSQHHAALHFIRWDKIEPPYRDIFFTKPKLPAVKKAGKKSKESKEIAVTHVEERLYNKENGRTAVIEKYDISRISIRYDDNNHLVNYQLCGWIKNVPFYPLNEFPPLYRKIEDLDSYIGIRFENIRTYKWFKGFLKPIFSDNKLNQFILRKLNVSKNVLSEEESSYIRYELLSPIKKNENSISWWKSFYKRSLDVFRENEINYVGIPYIYDICECEIKVNIVKIGFEATVEWLKDNPDWKMRVIFLCTSINTYKEYRAVCDYNTVALIQP